MNRLALKEKLEEEHKNLITASLVRDLCHHISFMQTENSTLFPVTRTLFC